MKPSKEQIKAWVCEAYGPEYPIYIENMRLSELAYAAGRKAGMEEALRLCQAAENGESDGEGVPMVDTAAQCVDAIRAAMEADT